MCCATRRDGTHGIWLAGIWLAQSDIILSALTKISWFSALFLVVHYVMRDESHSNMIIIVSGVAVACVLCDQTRQDSTMYTTHSK